MSTCKEILSKYVQGKSFKSLYKDYSPSTVLRCLKVKELTLQYLSNIDNLDEEGLDILEHLIKKNKDLKLNKKLVRPTLALIKRLGIENSLKLAGFMLASKKFSKIVKKYDEVSNILDQIKEKEYKSGVVRIGVSKPVIKTLIAIMLYHLIHKNDKNTTSTFFNGLTVRRTSNLKTLMLHIENISYIPMKEKVITLIKVLDATYRLTKKKN